MRSPHVVVGWHDWGITTGIFTYCLARAVAYEGGRIKACVRHQSPYTEEARNKVVETFLSLPYADYLLMVDADIEFEKDAISKTMWVAQNFDADVVWGNYALSSFSNSVFGKDPEGTELAVAMDNLNPNMIYHNVYGGGTGWCLMKRSLLEEMKEKYPGPWHWFERDVVKDQAGKEVKMGEDLSFGRRVWNMGKKQIAYTGIFLVHNKNTATVPQFMAPVAAELGTPFTPLAGAPRAD